MRMEKFPEPDSASADVAIQKVKAAAIAASFFKLMRLVFILSCPSSWLFGFARSTIPITMIVNVITSQLRVFDKKLHGSEIVSQAEGVQDVTGFVYVSVGDGLASITM